MFCTKCGNNIPDGMKFCNKCGNPVSASPAAPAKAPAASSANPVTDFVGKVMSDPKVKSLEKKGFLHYGAVMILLLISMLIALCGGIWHVGQPDIPEYNREYILDEFGNEDAYFREMEEEYEDMMSENRSEMKERLGYIPDYPYGHNNTAKNTFFFVFSDLADEDGYNAVMNVLVFFAFAFPFIASIIVMAIAFIPGVKPSSKFMWVMRPFCVLTILGYFVWTLIGHLVMSDDADSSVRISIVGVLLILFVAGAFVLSFIAGKKINEAHPRVPGTPAYGAPYGYPQQQPYGQPQQMYGQPQQPYGQVPPQNPNFKK